MTFLTAVARGGAATYEVKRTYTTDPQLLDRFSQRQWGYLLFILLDTPKDTPSAHSLENHGVTESNTCAADISVADG